MTPIIRFLFLCSLALISYKVAGQRSITYDFMEGLTALDENDPPLKPLGEPGQQVERNLPLLGGKRPVYQFEANSGLQFDNAAAGNLLSLSYTIELYFSMSLLDSWKRVLDFKNQKSDHGSYIYHGKLNFFNFATGENAPIRPNEFSHYVFSRDHTTGKIRIYANGEQKLEFKDPGNEAVLDQDQVLNFFQDDLVVKGEASAGQVALIRLYNYVLEPQIVKRSYQQLRERSRELTQRTPPPTPSPAPVEAPPPPTRSEAPLVAVTGKIFDKQSLNTPTKIELIVRRLGSEEVITKVPVIDGFYALELHSNEAYSITAVAEGYYDKTIIVRPTEKELEIKTFLNLERRFPLKPMASIPFPQTEATLTTDARAGLDSLANYMSTHPSRKVVIQGHTDNVGDREKNILLSWERVLVVKNYLIGRGIHPDRLDGQGYGPVRPVASNMQERTRQHNRRVEIWEWVQK